MELRDWVKAERGRATRLAGFLRRPASRISEFVAGVGAAKVPIEQCPYIQRFTGNEVTCEELRPDKAEFFALVRSLPTTKPAPVGATAGVFAIEPEARTPPPKPANQPPAAVAGQGF